MRTSDLMRIRHSILQGPDRRYEAATYAAGVDHALAAVQRLILEEMRAIEQERARRASGMPGSTERARTARMI